MENKIQLNREMFTNMLALQAKLNTETNGAIWITGVTNKGRNINWLKCISMEAAEMMDCFPWKHWKDINSSSDIENFKVEVVDVWHFALSGILEYIASNDFVLSEDFSEEEKQNATFEDVINFAIKASDKVPTYAEFVMTNYESLEETFAVHQTNDTILRLVEDLSFNLMLNPGDLGSLYQIQYVAEKAWGFSFQQMYNLYIGKNALNAVRTENGYKEGTYIKNWNTSELNKTVIEDNVIMRQLVANVDVDTISSYEEIKDALIVSYTEVTKFHNGLLNL
jgi:dimeric dUTPase (all-alpha-NTP-PPase superfamily)